MTVQILHVAAHLPEPILGNDELAGRFAGWTADKILAKTGIRSRRVCPLAQTAGDLAEAAARALPKGALEGVEALIFCTQSPDWLLPATACTLQHRLGLGTSCAAFDLNQGCSGYIYALGMATALISSGQAARVLVLTADTYTRFCDPADRTTVPLFGDAGTATVVGAGPGTGTGVGPFVYGTDGSGASDLVYHASACRPHADRWLRMDGAKVFAFAMRRVPEAVAAVLAKAGLQDSDIDLYVLHQATRFLIEALATRLGVSQERLAIHLEEVGNTVSSSIPLTLAAWSQDQRLRAGMRLLLVGFGVGYSWGACPVIWNPAPERACSCQPPAP